MSCSRTQHGGGRSRTPDLSLRSPTLYPWATALPYARMKLTYFIYLQLTKRLLIKHFTVIYAGANKQFLTLNLIFFAAKKSPYLGPQSPYQKLQISLFEPKKISHVWNIPVLISVKSSVFSPPWICFKNFYTFYLTLFTLWRWPFKGWISL